VQPPSKRLLHLLSFLHSLRLLDSLLSHGPSFLRRTAATVLRIDYNPKSRQVLYTQDDPQQPLLDFMSSETSISIFNEMLAQLFDELRLV
jgi:hypothetical protein